MTSIIVGLIVGAVAVILAVLAWAIRELDNIQQAIDAQAERAAPEQFR